MPARPPRRAGGCTQRRRCRQRSLELERLLSWRRCRLRLGQGSLQQREFAGHRGFERGGLPRFCRRRSGGANWQSGRVVGGLEADVSGSAIKGSVTEHQSRRSAPRRRRKPTKWTGSVRRHARAWLSRDPEPPGLRHRRTRMGTDGERSGDHRHGAGGAATEQDFARHADWMFGWTRAQAPKPGWGTPTG